MTIVDLLLLLKRRLPFIVIVVTIFIIVGSLASVYLLTPVYKAEVKLTITRTLEDENKIQSTYYNNLDADKNTKTYCNIIQDMPMMKLVAKALGREGVTASALAGMVSVDNVRDTSLVRITVKSEDPQLAADIANIFPDVVESELQRLMRVESVEPTAPSVDVPRYPVEPNVSRNTMMAALVGLIGSVALVVLLDYFDTTIKTEQDVRDKLGMNVIAILPIHRYVKNAKKSGGKGNGKKK